jgi:hypothetical protein
MRVARGGDVAEGNGMLETEHCFNKNDVLKILIEQDSCL